MDNVFAADIAARQSAGVARELTATTPKDFHLRKNYNMRLVRLPLPEGAIVRHHGRLVASPELVFLELAAHLDVHRLIFLGLQMCSHPVGRPAAAITSREKLASFVAKCSGHKGHRAAERALKYVQDGSGSPLESIAYMLLSLPHALGGFGLNDVCFNYEVPLTEEHQRRLRQKRCFVDLYYRKKKVGVEYESVTHHGTAAEQGKDFLRAAALERQGIDLMRMSTIQLYDKNACAEFARNLARRLGVRLRIRTPRFAPMHAALRSLLPTAPRPEAPAI
ncbi:MAG: hypothetical protein LBR14_03830 [Clostridiales Family XIII bacterium]|nr:hypothetical protein [Clostridiales Family XIII bacterium]